MEEVIKWKKKLGGSLRLNGRIIKPGQIFTATVSEIPKSFIDLVEPLDKLPVPEEEKPIIPVKAGYEVIPRGKSKTWFDVVNGQGKVLNEKALKKEDAEVLVKSFQ